MVNGQTERQPAFKDTPRDTGRHSKGVPLSRPTGASPPYFSPNTNALTIPEANAHLTHPQNYGARQAQAQFAPARATSGFSPSASVSRLRQSSAVRGRA